MKIMQANLVNVRLTKNINKSLKKFLNKNVCVSINRFDDISIYGQFQHGDAKFRA